MEEGEVGGVREGVMGMSVGKEEQEWEWDGEWGGGHAAWVLHNHTPQTLQVRDGHVWSH